MTSREAEPPGGQGEPAAGRAPDLLSHAEVVNECNGAHSGAAVRRLGRPATIVWVAMAGVWAVVVLVAYYSTAWPDARQWLSIPVLLHPPTLAAALSALREIFLAGWLCVLVVLAGRPVVRRLGGATLGEELLLAGGMGAGMIGTALFALAAVGLWYSVLLAGGAVVTTIALLPVNRDLVGRVRSAWRAGRVKERWAPVDVAILAVVVLALVIYLVGALSPEIYYDSLGYHLALPRLWLLRHRMVATPSVCFTGIPALMGMLYGLGLSVANEIVAKLLHYAAGAATLALLGLVAKRFAGRRAGWLAAMLFVTPPMLMLEFERSIVELGSCLFVGLFVWSLLRSATDEAEGGRWLACAAAFAGFALATKYTNAVMLLGAGAALWLLRPTSRRPARWWRRWVVVTAVAAAIVLPWLVKNAVFYRNPFYPMLDRLVPAWHVSGFDAAAMDAVAQARPLAATFETWHGFLALVKEPWTATMTGRSDGDFLGPAFLLSLPLLVFVRWTRPRGALAAAAGVGWLAASLLSALVRFRLPELALGCVVLAVAWTAAVLPAAFRRVGAWLLVAIGLTNLAWGAYALRLPDGWRVVQGRIAKAAYLDRPHLLYPSPYFAAAQFVNGSTPPEAGCIVLGDSRAYYLLRPFVVSSVFDQNPLLVLANTSRDGGELFARLRRGGWSTILLNAAEARRTRSTFRGSLTPHGREVFDEFWQRHTHEVFREEGSGENDRRLAFVFAVVPDRLALEPDRPRVVDAWFAALGEPNGR
jgi:hypothetical protein